MKERVLRGLAVLVLLLFCGSCLHNGSDIGAWYGTWHVDEVTCEGAQASYDGDYIFQFQNAIVRMGWQNALHDNAECFGNWQEGDDDTFTMTFPLDDMEPLALPGIERENFFAIEAKTSSRVVLRKVTPEGLYRYTLKKVI